MKFAPWLAFGLLSSCGGPPEDPADAPAARAVDPEAAAAAFPLFYAERVNRELTAFNRFGLFGHSDFATTIGRTAILRRGSDYEVVVGPQDNNLIGTSIYGVWAAYQHIGTREAELTLIRALQGLAFYEDVTGYPGLTSRSVLPGWTRVVDGRSGTETLTRFGEPVAPPHGPDVDISAEVIDTFFDGITVTYRENPEEYYFSHLPVADLEDYAITHSFSELPAYLRTSDCCSSAMRVPEGYPWAGAFWGNHNSRDNFPDLALGILAAMEAAEDPAVSADVRAAARTAVDAGLRIGDLIEASGGNIMTIDEYHAYGTLTVSGAIRPHGLPEQQDLGSLGSCPMVFLAEAISNDGLTTDDADLPMPGSYEGILIDTLGSSLQCELQEPRTCASLDDAYCGLTWENLDQLTLFDQPIFELIDALESASPGSGDAIFGSFQNDFDDVVESTVAVSHYARLRGDEALLAQAQANTRAQTELMRRFADALYADTQPEKRTEQRYEAAIFDALAGVDVAVEDLAGFYEELERIEAIEARLELAETLPPPLLTDDEIEERIAQGLEDLGDHESGRSDVLRDRYAAAYPDGPPVRRTEGGYEAKEAYGAWRPVETPEHVRYGRMKLFQALPICGTASDVLDCTWARLGCKRPDLDGSGTVDAEDRARFDAAYVEGARCTVVDAWCDGSDLDMNGVSDASDILFMEAAQGCWYR